MINKDPAGNDFVAYAGTYTITVRHDQTRDETVTELWHEDSRLATFNEGELETMIEALTEAKIVVMW